MRALSEAAARLRWRAARAWRSRAVRRAALVQAPAVALALTGAALARDPATHAWIATQARALGEALTAQPRFAIAEIAIEGASPALEAEIRAALSDALGVSSLSIRAEALRARVEGLTRVRAASAALQAPAQLLVRVRERRPAALLREGEALALIDLDGVTLSRFARRADHPELPVLTGAGAAEAVREALAIQRAAGPLAGRLRGLARIGERRWDAVLAYDVTLSLPAAAPEAAMRRLRAWHETEQLLDADIERVDLRLPARPTFRLRPRAREAFRSLQPELRTPPA